MPPTELEEGDRQLLLMALAHLSIERPGFDDALNRLACRYDRVKEGRAEMYDQFRALKAPAALSFTCPRCGQVSHNPHDAENRYCGRCHAFVED